MITSNIQSSKECKTIEIADKNLHFKQFIVDDNTLTGNQISAVAGFQAGSTSRDPADPGKWCA